MNIDKREVLKQITAAVMKGKDTLAMSLLDDFGKYVWDAAQKDANDFRMDKYSTNRKYPALTKTPYKK